MAYSYVRYTGDGSQTNFTFSIPYIAPEHIKVRVNDVLTSYTFLSASIVQVTPAPANGAIVEIRRQTPRDTVMVDYTDGSIFGEADLDLSERLGLYYAQETQDDVEDCVRLDYQGNLNAQGNRVVNATDGVVDTDLTTLGQVRDEIEAAIALSPQIVSYNSQTFNASEGQAVFTLDNVYSPGNSSLAVYLNGSKLVVSQDYTETSVTSFTLLIPASSGDVVVATTAQFVNPGMESSNSVEFVQSGAGAVARSAQDKLRESVSVLDFGAVGDGVTDDTAAIQAALDSGAGRVYFPSGTYLVKDATNTFNANVLVVPSNVTLFGDGASSIIKLGAHTTTAHRVLKIESKTNVAIRDLCIDGDKTNQTGAADEQSHCVFIYDSTNVTVQNCILKNAQGDGIYWGGATNPGSTNVLIDGCKFDGNVRQGISGVRGEYVRIVNNDIANTTGSAPGAGIDLEANGSGDTLRQVTISGNTIRGNYWGVFLHELAPAREVIIDGNTFYGNRATDILCRGRNVSISNNAFRVSGKSTAAAGIDVSIASNVTISGNSFVGDYTDTNERGAIRVQRDCSNIIIANNTIRETYLTAISLVTASLSGGPSNSISVIGNTLYDCVVAGSTAPVINLQPDNSGAADITNVIIRDNIIRDTRSAGNEADLGLRLVNATSAQLATWFIQNNRFTGVAYGVTNQSGWEFAAGVLVARAALNFDLTSVAYQDLTVSVPGALVGDIVSIGTPTAAAVADVVYHAWVSATDTVTVRAARVSGTPNPGSGTFNVMVTKLMTHA